MEFSFRNNKQSIVHTKNISILLIAITLILLSVIHLNYPFLKYSYKNPAEIDESVKIKEQDYEKCDISAGEWVPNPEAPYYTNMTCSAIHEHQNCMKYGRPDREFMKWKWKPDGCDLPVFNPYQFLDIVRGKSMAFIGDSVGRNQLQSLICLLSRVENPINVSNAQDEPFRSWNYVSYNFTLASYWTPFLVKSEEADPDGPTHTGLFNLYLDEVDESWNSHTDEFDYIVLNAGTWFYRPSMYYENRQLVGCRFCQFPNVTDFPMTYAARRAFKTALKAINSLENFKGVTFLRTYTPSHFENGLWNQGGNCVRQKPFRSNEIILEGANLDLYMTQIEEFRIAEREGKKKGSRFRLIDVTQAMLLRPDGHPSRYGHWPHENVVMYNDCVHWCLPGPVDSWNDFLFHLLKMERGRSHNERNSLP